MTEKIIHRAEALAAGFTSQQIQRAVHCGRWRRLRRGVYAIPDDDDAPTSATGDLAVRARAAVDRVRGPVWVSHQTAAGLWQLPLVDAPRELALSARPPRAGDDARQWRSYPGLKVFAATVPASHTCEQFALPILTVARTVVDLSRQWPLELALVVADAALRRRLVTLDGIDRVLADCRGWPGIRRAARVSALIDGARESPLESMSAAVLQMRGIERPVCQQEFYNDRHRFLGRVDFFWPRWNLIGEADGSFKYRETDAIVDSTPEDRWFHERERQRGLEFAGHRVVRWSWYEIRHQPWVVVRRIRESMLLSVRDGLAEPPAEAVAAVRRALLLAS